MNRQGKEEKENKPINSVVAKKISAKKDERKLLGQGKRYLLLVSVYRSSMASVASVDNVPQNKKKCVILRYLFKT